VCDVRDADICDREISTTLDELEQAVRELLSLPSDPTTPGPERERMSRDGVDSLALGAAPPGDVPSVGQKPHLVELKELRRTISTHCQKHRRAFRRVWWIRVVT
jgi:hypothetical protein